MIQYITIKYNNDTIILDPRLKDLGGRIIANLEKLTISIKAYKSARMRLVSDIHTELRKADALMLNYSSKTAVD